MSFREKNPRLYYGPTDPVDYRDDRRDWVIAIREARTIADAEEIMDAMFDRLREIEKLKS